MGSKFDVLAIVVGRSSLAFMLLTLYVLMFPLEVHGKSFFDFEAKEGDSLNSISSKSNFMNERYRGWLWFEEKEERKKIKKKEKPLPTPQEAAEEIEELKTRLEEKKNIMIVRPSAETVRDYIEVEELMWKKALALDSAYREAKFLYPEYFDKLQNPQNVHAVKFKRKLEQESLESRVRDFARKYDLVFFSKGGCGYCSEFAPVLKRFSEMYGFNTEEASIDGSMSSLSKGKKMEDLAKRLGIEVTPTVVAVRKDGKKAFELIRGYVTITELEEYVGLAIEYASRIEEKRSN